MKIAVNNQRGMSKWGWLFTIVFIVLGVTQALRLGPHYMDYGVIQTLMDRLPAGEVHSEMTRAEIREHFSRQFRVENFPHKVKDILTVDRDRERTVVRVAYEVREPLFYNAYVVLAFQEERTYE